MKEKGVFTRAAFVGVATEVMRSGGTTAAAEKRLQSGGGLDPLVNPSGGGIHGPVRLSLPRFVETKEGWQLVMGPPMLLETLLDTTGSMGGNVDRAFRALPHLFEMIGEVLSGYDPQIINATFGDVVDQIVLCRSQAEMAEKIAQQLTLMPPERDGGDADEDPEYGLFGAAYLTKARIQDWGLKSYHFLLSDAGGRGKIDNENLTRVFGSDVLEKVAENGHQLGNNLPNTCEIVRDLKRTAHAFFLQVGGSKLVTSFWAEVYGKDRVIPLQNIDFLPQVQAAIIGLTEGKLSLGVLKNWLTKTGNLMASDADNIVRALSHIPVGEQSWLPNFSKIPKKGDMFRAKTDLWPIGHEFADVQIKDSKVAKEKTPEWL